MNSFRKQSIWQRLNLLFFSVSFLVVVPTHVAAETRIRFAAIGDYGSGSLNEGDVANLIDSWNVDFVITAGDNRYGSTTFDQVVGQFYCNFLKDAKWGDYCSDPIRTRNAFFPSLGNHDYDDGGGVSEYLSYFTLPGNERYYDFVWGPVHFFAINSDSLEPDGTSSASVQAKWLKNQLAASTTPWQIVYFHHAAYSSGLRHGNTAYMQWPFAAWGSDAVIAGHDHTYERINLDGIVYFVNGLGGKSKYTCAPVESRVTGSQVCYDEDYGAMLIEANESNIKFQFINRAGVVIDNYNIDNYNTVGSIHAYSDITGTWSSGVWYWDAAASIWTQMTAIAPTGDIAAGDFTGDEKADVASIWDNGLWYQDGDTLDWTKVSNKAPTQVTAGDVTGDGRSEIIGTWSSGVWYWDVAVSKWTKMTASTPTGDIAAGDFTGDGKADIASCWDNGLWYQDGATLDWTKVSNTAPTQLTASGVTGD